MNEPVRIILIILLVLGLSNLYNKYLEKSKLKSLSKKRKGVSKSEYIQYFQNEGFEKTEIEVVHDKLKLFLAEHGFQLNPEDDFHKDYRISDLDDIELISQAFESLKLPFPKQEDYDLINQNFTTLNSRYLLTLIKNQKENMTRKNNPS